MLAFFVVVVGAVSAATAAPAPAACQLAVFDLEQGEGVSSERVRALGDVVTAAIGAAAPDCHVLARAELRAMVSQEVERQLGGCDQESCLSEVGDALGVDRAVMGSVAVVDDTLVVVLRLVDLSAARVEARASESSRGDAVAITTYAARRLMLGDRAGARPAEPASSEPAASLWRNLAWAGVGSGAGLALLGAGLGGGTVALASLSTSMKSSRGTTARDVDSVDAVGPWLAGGANLSLYLAAGAVVVGGALFFLPATNEEPR